MSSSATKSLNMNSVNHGRLSQRFDLIRKLGQGTYGKVQLGINKMTGVEVALKTIKKSKIESSSDLLRIKREISIMSCCNHPNIIHIYEVYENKEKIILVMEYAQGGELYDYLNEKKKLEEDEAKRIFSQISSAIYYCHKHSIVHRDLKLENILLDENNNAKIADFGLSNVYGDQLLKTFCGSPLYASPEIVKGIPYQGPEVDCWSLGVLLYTLVYGSMPFDGTHFKKLVKQITSGTFYEPTFKSGAAEIIKCLLTVDSKRRLNINQVVSHPWLQSTECQSISQEYCNLAPVKGEFLVGINKSDTLDEVSEISSTSVDESDTSKEKSKSKPPRKSPKLNENESGIKGKSPVPEKSSVRQSNEGQPPVIQVPKGQTPVIEVPKGQTPVIQPTKVKVTEEAKPAKPTRNTDKMKTDVPKSIEMEQIQNDQPQVNEKILPPPDDTPNKCEVVPTKLARNVTDVAKSEKLSPVPGRQVFERVKPPEPKSTKTEKETSKVPETVKTETPKPTKTEIDIKASRGDKKSPSRDNEATNSDVKGRVKVKIEEKHVEQFKTKEDVPAKPEPKKLETVKQKSPAKDTPAPDAVQKTSRAFKQKSPAKDTPAPEKTSTATPKTKLDAVEPEVVAPAVVLRKRSTSTPTSEEPSSPTTPVPVRPTERRNSKTLSPKTAELIQNFEDPGKDQKKPGSKLSDIKKKFESNGQSKPDESGIGCILKRRKSIVDAGDTGTGVHIVDKAETVYNNVSAPAPMPAAVSTNSYHNNQAVKNDKVSSAPQPITSAVKPPAPTKAPTVPKVLNLVIEREIDVAPQAHPPKNDVNPPQSRPALKLIMPKSTTKTLSQPPVSASPPITKQGAVKKIGSLISKVKSNETSCNSSGSGSRERVIPIQFDDDRSSPVSRSGTGGTTSGPPSRTGSISISILSGDGHSSRADSRSLASLGSPASTLSSPSYSRHNSFGNGIQQQNIGTCQIMKSKREFIIPITIEERDGDTTPSTNSDLLTRRNSSTATASSSGASSSSRVYSNRRHTSSNLSLLSPDSTDLEDDFFDDDDFLSSEALFSSLLQRVRGLRISDRLFDNDKKGKRNGRWTNLEFKRN